MSPTPPANESDSLARATDDFRRVWPTVFSLGGGGALARLLLSKNSPRWSVWVKRILAGCLVGSITYFGLYDANISGLYKALIQSTVGVAAAEAVELVINKWKNGKLPSDENEPAKEPKRKQTARPAAKRKPTGKRKR
jgi:hypothetical protein